MTAVYLDIVNGGSDSISLTAVSTPLAAGAEIHETVELDGVSKMVRRDGVTIRPAQTRYLRPGGLHIMLRGLDRPLVAGEQLPLILGFDDGTALSLAAQVMPPDYVPPLSQ